jgi:hypothetical protein
MPRPLSVTVRSRRHPVHLDEGGVAGDGLVHRVVDDFGEQVVQRLLVGAADIHAGAAAHRLQPFQHALLVMRQQGPELPALPLASARALPVLADHQTDQSSRSFSPREGHAKANQRQTMPRMAQGCDPQAAFAPVPFQVATVNNSLTIGMKRTISNQILRMSLGFALMIRPSGIPLYKTGIHRGDT